MGRQEAKVNHVPDGWLVAHLGDVAEVVGGSTPSRANEAFWGGSIPWVVPSELTELSGRYLTDTRESISQAGMKSAGLRSIPAGSILLTSRATIGVTAINAMPLVTNQGFQNLVVKNGADALWLYYCVSNRRGELQRRAAGSTFREVSRDSVRSLPILLPPLSEQRAIADVLDAIDEAIERTEAVIDATERLRDALLHDLLTRGVPGWHSEWREVPGLGTVPTAWDVVRLGERAKILSGAAFSSAYFSSNEGLPLIRNRDINSSDTELRYFGPYDDKYLVHPGDLLVRMDGDFQAAKWKGRLALLNQRVARVSVSESALDASILYYAIHKPLALIQHQTTGTTVKHLSAGQIAAIPIPDVSVPEQQAIAATLDSVDATIERAGEERHALQSLKASASDALLSGRVHVFSGV